MTKQERDRKYYLKNREYIRARALAYRTLHPERVLSDKRTKPMTDPDKTLPPNTPRNLIARAVAWGQAHPDWLLAFVLGFIAGALIL